MSRIECDATVGVLGVTYKILLQKKIDEVRERIGFDDSDITWVIYDQDAGKSNLLQTIRVRQSEDYGYSSYSRKEIGISLWSIQNGKQADSPLDAEIRKIVRGTPIQNDLLADVLLDEITHIQTRGAAHGEPIYDDTLKENRRRYYGLNPI